MTSGKPDDPKTAELDTSKLRTPDEDTSQEPTPIGDEAKAAAEAYLKDVDEEDVTHTDEDDDPVSLAGDEVEEDNA